MIGSTQKARAWLRISKPFKHQTMLYPFLLGTVIAWSEVHVIDWTVFWISLLAVVLMVTSVYISNDYFDYGTDKRNVSRFTGGSKVLVEGLLERKMALKVSILLGLAAIPLGIYLQFYKDTGPLTLPLGLFGLILAYAYSGTPFRLSYIGLGEVSLAFNNSWTPIFAGYYLQAHHISWVPTIVSIPYILAVFSQKLLRELPDREVDGAAGRRNLVVLFGKERIASAYPWIVLVMFLLCLPLSFLGLHKESLLLLLIPTFFFSRNVLRVGKGDWKSAEGLGKLNRSGFAGMFALPIVFIMMFILKGLI